MQKKKIFVNAVKAYGKHKFRFTHSQSRLQMEVSGQHHTQGTLPRENMPVLVEQEAEWAPEQIWSIVRRETFFVLQKLEPQTTIWHRTYADKPVLIENMFVYLLQVWAPHFKFNVTLSILEILEAPFKRRTQYDTENVDISFSQRSQLVKETTPLL